MSRSSLPSDDLPPSQISELDRILRRQLEASTAKHFYESCDGVTQSVLSSCEWSITTNSSALMLVINCPDLALNWRVLNNIVPIGTRLAQFSSRAKIRVCPPDESGTPFEIRVDEISLYRDPL